jgi:hypothetical protein
VHLRRQALDSWATSSALLCIFFFETGSLYVAQAGLERSSSCLRIPRAGEVLRAGTPSLKAIFYENQFCRFLCRDGEAKEIVVVDA